MVQHTAVFHNSSHHHHNHHQPQQSSYKVDAKYLKATL